MMIVTTDSPTLTQDPPDKQLRLPFLDGVRAVACLEVLLHHLRNYTHLETSGHMWLHLLTVPLYFGHLWVGVFIVVSGFCLALPLTSGRPVDYLDFFKRRAHRILPTYYAAMGVALLLLTLTGKWEWSLRDIAAHIFMFHNWMPDIEFSIVGPFWSLAPEVQIYLLFPLVVLVWRKTDVASFLTIATIIGLCLASILGPTSQAHAGAHYLGLFMLGMAACTIVHGHAPLPAALRDIAWGLITLLLSGCIVAITMYFGTREMPRYEIWVDVLVGLTTSSLLVYLSVGPSWLRDILSIAPLRYIGKRSYSVYLAHGLWMILLARLVGHQAEQLPYPVYLLLLAFVALPLVLLGCFAFFEVFERPFVHFRRSLKPVPART